MTDARLACLIPTTTPATGVSSNPTPILSPPRKKHQRASTWSRAGCITCKKRRKRCDGAKPSCHNCAKLGRVCEGYESLWAQPLDQSAVVFREDGQKGKKRAASSTSSDPSGEVLSTLTSTTASPDTDITSLESYAPYAPSTTLTLTHPIPTSISTNTLTSAQSHYLQYHITSGSKLLANLENPSNPLRSLLIPRALASPLLMSATCAMAAMHLSNRAVDGFAARNAATQFYITTMRELRKTLEDCDSGGGGGVSEDVILTIGLLCKYEIVRGSVRQWAVHLVALQRVVDARGGHSGLEEETAELIYGFFVYAHNIARVTNRHITGLIPDAAPGDERSGDCVRIRKLDIYIGYTEDIIKLCARISNLPSIKDPFSLHTEVQRINNELIIWSPNTTNTRYIIPPGITPPTLHRLVMVAECFRDAAFIYVHSILRRIQDSTLSQPNNTNDTYSDNASSSNGISTPVSKAEALTRLLSRVQAFPLENPAYTEFSALTFPLFIAGCESHSPMQTHAHAPAQDGFVQVTDRDVILWALGCLGRNFGIGNVGRVREMLGVVWGEKGKGRHWMDMLEDMGWDLILA